jgi:hypothetical protein
MLKAPTMSVLFFIFIVTKLKSMKTYIIIISILLGLLFSCNSHKDFSRSTPQKIESDTIRIANDELAYEIIIIDGGFTNWFNTFARPRGFYTQAFLETRNRIWVQEWNYRANLPMQYSTIYDWPINYDISVDYGYEVNYMLYNYLVYFQLNHKQKLGGYTPRI